MAIQIIRSGTKQVIGPFQRFFQKFVQGSYLLFAAAIIALAWAVFSHETYHAVWHADLALSLGPFHLSKSVAHWINDALMAIFFLMVGLEIKREFLVGGLSTFDRAILPVAAACGGMIVPALFYLIFNYGTPGSQGWGIPMATDIAFAMAVLALLGDRIPIGLKVFLSAFAIADDLGAVLVIAVFYTKSLNGIGLLFSGFFIFGLYMANRLWVRTPVVYVILGFGLWLSILKSGIHATVAGVILAMFIPARAKYDTDFFISTVKTLLGKIHCGTSRCGFSTLLNREHLNAVQAIDLACQNVETPLQRFEHALQPWVAYLILPLFALANAGVVFEGFHVTQALSHPVTLGIFMGLFFGKPLGITLFCYAAIKCFNITLTEGKTMRHIIGVSFLGGIGFTMSLFINELSFTDPLLISYAKFAIINASVLAGITGFCILRK